MRPRTAVALVVAPGDRELLKLLEQIELFVNAESDDSASWRKPPEESRPGQAAWTARRERVKRRPAGGQRSLCPHGGQQRDSARGSVTAHKGKHPTEDVKIRIIILRIFI